MLQSLKEKIELDLEVDGQLSKFRDTFRSAEGKHFCAAGGFSAAPSPVRMEILGFHFWWRGARSRYRGILGTARFAVIQGYGLTEIQHPRLGKGRRQVLAGR